MSASQVRAQHPDYWRGHIASIRGDANLNYIERVAQLALFFFELAEEGTNGHSRLIRDQLPSRALNWKKVQTQFREIWYGIQALSLTDAALAFHRWIEERDGAPKNLIDAESGIRALCLPYERSFEPVTDPRLCLDRAYLRLARFYRRMVREDVTLHSRTVERFVSNAEAPQNQGLPGHHPEHVVPCVVMRDMAMKSFENHASVYDVAAMLRRWLVVIWIEQSHRVLLDQGENNLKNRMPGNWDRMTGCVYARLHEKNIRFVAASAHPCSCGK